MAESNPKLGNWKESGNDELETQLISVIYITLAQECLTNMYSQMLVCASNLLLSLHLGRN